MVGSLKILVSSHLSTNTTLVYNFNTELIALTYTITFTLYPIMTVLRIFSIHYFFAEGKKVKGMVRNGGRGRGGVG